MRPKIIAIEGVDGSGKTALMKSLYPLLDFKYIILDRFAVSAYVYNEMTRKYPDVLPKKYHRKVIEKASLYELNDFFNELNRVFREVHLILLTTSLEVLEIRRPEEDINFLKVSQDFFQETVKFLLSEAKTYQVYIYDTSDSVTSDMAALAAKLILKEPSSRTASHTFTPKPLGEISNFDEE